MSEKDDVQRTILPIPDRPRPGLVTYDAKDPDTKYPPITPIRPPKGAPNVLIVLIDDAGFGSAIAFGGPCNTPTAERLAAGGFKYFYGFIGGEANQWYPSLYEGTTPVEVKKTPDEGYHLMEDMTDKAINWIGHKK